MEVITSETYDVDLDVPRTDEGFAGDAEDSFPSALAAEVDTTEEVRA